MRLTPIVTGRPSGQIGKTIIGQTWFGRPFYRAYFIPSNPNTNAQKAWRNLHSQIISQWKTIYERDDSIKTGWNELAYPRRYSGYNLYTSLCKHSKIMVQAVMDPDFIWHTIITWDINKRENKSGICAQEPGGDLATIVYPEYIYEHPEGSIELIGLSFGKWKFWVYDNEVRLNNIGQTLKYCRHAHWWYNQNGQQWDPCQVTLYPPPE